MREQVAEAQVWVQRHVPDYKLRTLALPHGVYPKDLRWVQEGNAKGTTYRTDGVLMVAGGPAPSPFAKTFDPMRIPRIQAIETDMGAALKHFEANPSDRYVSDGDATTITIPRDKRDKLKLSLPKDLKVIER